MKAHKTDIKEPNLNDLFAGAEELEAQHKADPKLVYDGGVKAQTSTFVKADEKDAEQIIEEENTGQITSSEWFYEVAREELGENDSKKIIVGYKPSYTGVIKCMMRQGNLEVVGNPLPEHTSSKFIYTVQVRDTQKNISLYGQGFCDKMNKVKHTIEPYAQAIALSIATRNAYDKLIDDHIKKEVLDEWYKLKYGEEKDMSQIIVVSGDALKDLKSYVN